MAVFSSIGFQVSGIRVRATTVVKQYSHANLNKVLWARILPTEVIQRSASE